MRRTFLLLAILALLLACLLPASAQTTPKIWLVASEANVTHRRMYYYRAQVSGLPAGAAVAKIYLTPARAIEAVHIVDSMGTGGPCHQSWGYAECPIVGSGLKIWALADVVGTTPITVSARLQVESATGKLLALSSAALVRAN